MEKDTSFTGPEMVRYWKTHNVERGHYDPGHDPDGLNNVCHPGVPRFVNRFYARGQRRVYESLLASVPIRTGDRALDVGCGAARWVRVLSRRGYAVTGIDVQDDLVEANRARDPLNRYECCLIQDFHSAEPFELVSSVTVLQHLPYSEQSVAARRISESVADGAHLLILENISDHGAHHVFPRPIAGWVELFGEVGFRSLRVLPYDYSPALRAYARASQLLRSRDPADEEPRGPEKHLNETQESLPALLRRAALFSACLVDSAADPLLGSLKAPVPTVHVGLLFQKQS